MKSITITLLFGLSLATGATLANDIDFIDETTMDVISNEQDAAEVDIPTISLEMEPASEPLADATEQRNEVQERTIDAKAGMDLALIEMREIRNENVEERCNDLREETKRELVRHEEM
jgi:hypothetical protein